MEKIDLDQLGVDIRTEILNQITEGLIDQDDEKDGRERHERMSPPSLAICADRIILMTKRRPNKIV